MSIVRENLLTRLNYTPYCGANLCRSNWPRMTFYNGQFECPGCGHRTNFEPEFIAEYKAAQAELRSAK